MTAMTRSECSNLGILENVQRLRDSGQLGVKALALLDNVEAAEKDYQKAEAAYGEQLKAIAAPIAPGGAP